MSGTGWQDLERAWQSLPASATPAIEELKHGRRWQWWSYVYLASEIVIGLVGFAVGLWLLLRGDVFSIVIGIGTLAFTAVVSAASIWARSLSDVRYDDPVMQTVGAAIRRVEIGLRMARAYLWSICAALGYLAVLALVISFHGAAKHQEHGYLAIAVSLTWLCLVFVGTLIYQQRRSGDLARLKAIESALRQEI